MTPMDMKVATRRLAPAALALVAAAGAAADTEALMAAEPNAEGEADTDAEGVEVLVMDVVATTRVLDSTLVGTAEEEADEFEVAAARSPPTEVVVVFVHAELIAIPYKVQRALNWAKAARPAGPAPG